MSTGKVFRPLLIFYVLVVYIFAAFLWWFCLHMRHINERAENEILLMEKIYIENNLAIEEVYTSFAYEDTLERQTAQRWMIIGEGVVFLIILILGCYKIHSGIRKEILFNRQQRNFLLSITHELKSPLAGIKLSLETIINRNLDPERQRRMMSNSMKDVERLRALVDNILMAAKIENSSFTLANEQVNLSNIVEENARLIKAHFGHISLLNTNISSDLYVHGDRTALDSIIINLVENAIKYSPKNSEVRLDLSIKKEMVRISVSDNGIGVPDSEKDKIFNKFYRVGNEDTRKAKGTGLGLYIVKQLVDLHNGIIYIKDNKPKGSIFVVEIPGKKISQQQLTTLPQKKAS